MWLVLQNRGVFGWVVADEDVHLTQDAAQQSADDLAVHGKLTGTYHVAELVLAVEED